MNDKDKKAVPVTSQSQPNVTVIIEPTREVVKALVYAGVVAGLVFRKEPTPSAANLRQVKTYVDAVMELMDEDDQ